MPTVQCAEADGVGLDGATRPSEDRIAILPNAVLLLDGATNLVPGRRSGGWYAGELITTLQQALRDQPSAPLPDLLATSISVVAQANQLTIGDSPSATVAMLRWSPSTVDALVLADSPVVALTAAGPDVVADTRLATLPRRGGGYRTRLAEGGGFGDDHVAAMRTGAAATGRLRNVPGGFWVAEADPAAAHQAVTRSWPRDAVRAAVLASDGVSCGVDDYALFDWPEVFTTVAEQGCAAVLDRVRAAERADPDGVRWPRPKVSDDQALAYVNFGGEGGYG